MKRFLLMLGKHWINIRSYDVLIRAISKVEDDRVFQFLNIQLDNELTHLMNYDALV